MAKNHLKSLNTPKTWNILRKAQVFVTRPYPGQSSLLLGMPISLILRDQLHIATTQKEVKYILHQKEILANNKVVCEPKYIVGFMDTLSVPKLKKHYRGFLTQKGKITFIEIPESEKDKKVCKIIGKKFYKGKTQINLYDGRNILVDKDSYTVGDSVLISIPQPKILDHFKLEKGAFIVLTGGKHVGQKGTIEHVDEQTLRYKRAGGEVYQTDKKHAFVIGKHKEALTLPNS